MRSIAVFLLLTVIAAGTRAQSSVAPSALPAPQSIEFSIIKTSEVTTLEAMTYSGGDYTKAVKLNHVAILVRHPQGSFLFDTGLGRKIDAQFQKDMPLWAKPFFSYGPVKDARTQLDAAGIAPIARVILSHGHWDHASGLADFPEAAILVSEQEKTFLSQPHSASVLPSQISSPAIRWQTFQFLPQPYRDFATSVDLFNDGSAVLVPLAGHTPGSTGLYLTLKSGQQFLFIGDAVWKGDAISKHRPKMWLASKIVDNDAVLTDVSIEALDRVQQANPTLTIVPAHDAAIQDKIGYFPSFIR